MNKLIIAIHGNPGDRSDFGLLFEKLNLAGKADIILLSRPQEGADLDKLVTDIQNTLSKYQNREITLIAYSWGCYLACLWTLTRRMAISRMIFISPTIVAENHLASIVAHISRLPVIGNLLLKKAAGKQSHDFIEKCFYPQKPTSETYTGLSKKLGGPNIWRGAIRYKYQQQKIDIAALGSINDIELVIIRGEQDASVDWSVQETALCSLFPYWDSVVVHTIKNAGHALPWTQPDRLAKIVQDTLKYNESDSSSVSSLRTKNRANNVVSFLKAYARNSSTKIALRWVESSLVRKFQGDLDKKFDTNEINYYDFYQTIGRLAKGLTELGISAGDRVILFLPMSLEMYVAMFAIQHIGAVAVFLDSWARRNHLGASAKCVSPKAMISHAKAFELMSGIAELDNIDLRIIAGPGQDDGYSVRLETLLCTSGSVPITPVYPDDTALITFTTGSSGEPKGANRTHRFLYAQHDALKNVVPYKGGDSDIPAFPIFSLNNLASGVTTVLPAIDLAHPSPNDAAVLVNQIVHENITCTTLSPSMLNAVSTFCLSKKLFLSSVRRVITGGAPISRDNVSDFCEIAPNAEIWILYGSTEVEPMAHIEAREMLSMQINPDKEIVEEGVNVGRIADGLRYKFIRPYKDAIKFDNFKWEEWELPENEIGEFVVSGDHVCTNYYNNEAAFLRTKIRELDGSVWHRTGDLARLDPSGNLWIVGRVHNMVRRQEQNFFPVKAEVILSRCDFIKKSAFLGLSDTNLGERTAVVVQFSDGFDDKQAGVKEILRLFRKNKIIVDCLYEVDEIPMDPRHHSKVEYTLLRNKILQGKQQELIAEEKNTKEIPDHVIAYQLP